VLSRLRHTLATRHNVRAHFWQSLANYAQQGGSVVLGVFLARLLTPDDFGAIAYATALVGLICMPLDWTAAQVLVADRGQNPDLFSEVMSLGIIVTGIKLAVCIAVVFWQWICGDHQSAVLIAFASFGVVGSTTTVIYRAAVEGLGQFKPNFQVQVTTMILCFVVGVGLALAGAGVYSLAWMAVVGALPPLLVYPRYVTHKFKWRLDKGILKSRGVDGFWLWLQAIFVTSTSRLDKIFLNHAAGSAELGNYTRAQNYCALSHLAMNSLMSNPAVLSFANATSAAARRRIFFNNGALLLLGGLASFLVFGPFASVVVPFVFGQQWIPAVPTFQAFAPINLFYAAVYLPVALLLAFKCFRAIALVHLSSLITLTVMSLMILENTNAVNMAYIFQTSLLVAALVSLFFITPLLIKKSTF
jgi:O-antigen/teichoic acid export membrane protein